MVIKQKEIHYLILNSHWGIGVLLIRHKLRKGLMFRTWYDWENHKWV